ncbi:MAG TPA: hypothetical protein VGS97_23190 [Actinocrinis sp.]|uniref:hypothetical protein n=1 Tax=Actinocrinis sp. TaxID=1920516 RepID=UPI002DDD5DD0|nr:hypothetical protein [Actinocrinis sp.]HEV2347026.1 hypothetical protein [Actinocrinis sp.]
MSTPAPSNGVALADEFDAQRLALNTLGYRLFGLLSRALRAMYPTASYVTVSLDSVDEGRYLALALGADGAQVYDFAEHDGQPLPELPVDLAAHFGRYDPRDLREMRLLLNDACGTGAQLPYVPEHLDGYAAGAVRCLLLHSA